MIQPSVYSREQIIETAFELVREKGWPALTTRSIAKKMGSSTMPIYSHVRSLDELEKEIRFKARVLLKEYQQRSYTDQVLLNLAFGYVVFARDEKMLFRFLYLDKPGSYDLESEGRLKNYFLSEFGEESEEGKELAEMEESGQEAVVKYAWIFTHGLAMLVNSGAFSSVSDQVILRYLKNAGEAFYVRELSKGGDINDSDSN